MTKNENKIRLCEMIKTAFIRRDLTKGQKVIFARLLLYAGKDGIAYPTMARLAADVGGSVPQVRRDVEFLEAKKLICIERKPKRANRYSFPNTIMDDSIMDDSIMDDSIMDDSINTIMDDSQKRKEEKKNINNAHLTNARKCVDLFGGTMQAPEQKPASVFSFADFWALYPRKVGKKDAERIFGKLPEKTRALIKERLPEFVKEWQGKEAVFIPHPSTWLNGERWLDEAQPRPQAKTLDEVFNSLHG